MVFPALSAVERSRGLCLNRAVDYTGYTDFTITRLSNRGIVITTIPQQLGLPSTTPWDVGDFIFNFNRLRTVGIVIPRGYPVVSRCGVPVSFGR